LRIQDAADALAGAADGSVDLVFLDAERPHYVAYWPQLLRVLRPGGLLAVDNAISHAHELEEFTALVEADPRVMSTVVPVGAGLRLAVGPPRPA
jgi:predicted O-methyltransferase YrrM